MPLGYAGKAAGVRLELTTGISRDRLATDFLTNSDTRPEESAGVEPTNRFRLSRFKRGGPANAQTLQVEPSRIALESSAFQTDARTIRAAAPSPRVRNRTA